MTLTPGLLAHLYRMRWDIEKIFDEAKNRLNQKKAWATSATAKLMQGHFIALAHNLLLILSDRLQKEEGIEDFKKQDRRRQRRTKEEESGATRSFAKELANWLLRATQRGVKFIRWLRAQLRHPTSWSAACAALTRLYARL
jgi:hypothetical protein